MALRITLEQYRQLVQPVQHNRKKWRKWTEKEKEIVKLYCYLTSGEFVNRFRLTKSQETIKIYLRIARREQNIKIINQYAR